MLEIRPRTSTEERLAHRRRARQPCSCLSRIDLHLHSGASGAVTNWWVKSLGLGVESRESSTESAAADDMVGAAKMGGASPTGHDSIATRSNGATVRTS